MQIGDRVRYSGRLPLVIDMNGALCNLTGAKGRVGHIHDRFENLAFVYFKRAGHFFGYFDMSLLTPDND